MWPVEFNRQPQSDSDKIFSNRCMAARKILSVAYQGMIITVALTAMRSMLWIRQKRDGCHTWSEGLFSSLRC